MGFARRVLLVLLGCWLLPAACRPSPPREHVVVRQVDPGGSAARAGVRPGDLILRWERGALQGPVRSAHELRRVERGQAPLGAVTLHGRRGGKALAFALRSDDWRIEVQGPAGPESPAGLEAPTPLEAAHGHAAAGARAVEILDLRTAHTEWQRARELAESVSADNLVVARASNGLGAVAQLQGETETAEDLYRRALAVAEARDPESAVATTALANLGALLRARGDYAAGEEYLRRALAVHERHDPEGEQAAHALNALGVLAKDRGDLEAAEALYQRALAIHERRSPGSLRAAGLLNNLGNAARQRGDLAAAEGLHRRGLAIREARQPRSLDTAASLHNLGQVALDGGRLDEADALLRRSLEMKQTLAPEGAPLANTLLALGRLELQRGDTATARAAFRQALDLRSKLAPDSAAEAEAWQAWGELERREGRTAEALAAWRRAVAALEAQRGRLGGDLEARVGFSAQHAALFQSLMELLVDSGREAEAFHVLERSRARALLEMLSERDLALAAAISPELDAARRRLDREYERVQGDLAAASPVREAARVEAGRRRLRALSGEREALAARVRAASPALASLQYPRPLDLPGARRVLDPGTVLLAFAVGPRQTLAFVAGGTRAGVAAHRLPWGEDELRRRVSAFRGLIERGRGGGAIEPALRAQSHQLYRDLLGPAGGELAGAQRLVVVPDGPLHALPFAALSPEPGRFLVGWRPLHVVLSTTLYAELQRSRGRRRRGGRLAAFGDARYPPSSGLAPLPASRLEVQRIAALYAPGAMVALGEQATEARVMASVADARYVHFAVHGLLDRHLPLESALVLSPPAPGEAPANGRLQAWEVLERVRLDADLVTLSACETGLGREMAGEGLIGLVRAFHHAGSPSVLASLWAVSDRSTAELMVGFYAGLRKGLPKDEALRQAQLAAVRAGIHPFHWAAFALHGDWR